MPLSLKQIANELDVGCDGGTSHIEQGRDVFWNGGLPKIQ